ncbi:MAG: tetratricopeptide repeat protein [Candidatus Omnitrophica bacterium]|nr:tetratricopeptide repeat protein [Candidatus Omnitrophota bacterium]
MKRKIKAGVLFLSAFTLLTAGMSGAQEFLRDEDRASFGLALSLNNLKRYSEAEGYLEELYRRYPENVPVLLELVKSYGYGDKPDEAIFLLDGLGKDTAGNPDVLRLRIGILETHQRFQEAKACADELYRLNPRDARVLQDIAHLFLWTGDLEGLIAIRRQLLSMDPGNTRLLLGLGDAYSWAGAYGPSAEIYRRLLEQDPDRFEVKLRLARVLSWAGRYDESLEAYRELKVDDPKQVLLWREEARVLGWMLRYADSFRVYDEAIARFGPQGPLVCEKDAKEEYYRGAYQRGVKYYQAWLTQEPDNQEALFDLGQTYSLQEMWPQARQEYARLLDLVPTHFRARQALDKAALKGSHVVWDEELSFYEADSGERFTNERYISLDSHLSMPLSSQWKLGLGESNFWYDFSGLRVLRSGPSMRITWNRPPHLQAEAGYDFNHYTKGLQATHTFHEKIIVKPDDFNLFLVSHERRDVTDNENTVRSSLQRDDYMLRWQMAPIRRLAAGADYTFSHFTDENERWRYGIDGVGIILFEPRALKVFFRHEAYGFRDPSRTYFAPGSFHTTRLGVEWRHFLNKEGLFWGALDTYYTFRYNVILDVHDQTGHAFYLDVHRDWSKKFSTHLEASKTFYERKGIWTENRVTVKGTYYF